MTDKQVDKAFVVYFPTSQLFLCGTSRNRKTGPFSDARLFSKERHANLSSEQAQSEFSEHTAVIPVDIVLDPKDLFYSILRGPK